VMLAPRATGSGESVFVTDRSAEAETVVVSVSELLLGSSSGVADAAVATLLMVVPGAVPGFTFTTSVKAAPDTPNEGLVAVTVPVPPTAGVVAVHPAGAVNDTNVVLAGTASVSVTFAAFEGPEFVTWIAYDRLEPGATGSGVSVLIARRFAVVVTVVDADAELLLGLGSDVDEVTEAVFVMTVPAGVAGLIRATTVMTGEALCASVARVQLTVPFVPTAGVVHVKPPALGRATKVVFAGNGSVIVTFWASSGPRLLSTAIVYVTSEPAVTVAVALLTTNRSAAGSVWPTADWAPSTGTATSATAHAKPRAQRDRFPDERICLPSHPLPRGTTKRHHANTNSETWKGLPGVVARPFPWGSSAG
jgi:hypothetical protein